jgi:hypothetical protein
MHVSNVSEVHSYFKEDTLRLHYKTSQLMLFKKTNRCVFRESYEERGHKPEERV